MTDLFVVPAWRCRHGRHHPAWAHACCADEHGGQCPGLARHVLVPMSLYSGATDFACRIGRDDNGIWVGDIVLLYDDGVEPFDAYVAAVDETRARFFVSPPGRPLRRMIVDWTRIGAATDFVVHISFDLDPDDVRVGDLLLLYGDGVPHEPYRVVLVSGSTMRVKRAI